ncbi:hypothetical protein HETIRDRAFT_447288 [Heterobasidion irregulare TC 32-1]|uniref:Uncharacterized protein n=1 Tax=Heterobasidion irregulare (strain TC 32-1) TaxID=747525 RepID=W4KMH7_HETIT|nr:uncharacterized protein HETIRDRAFT_447288 [Heterobasidion irregulare TC 32-1]ETW86580.1 hypothetical protein HETIRDRAFT_447288 [Heterobasidion irregulare TC 32-1]
MYVESSIRSRPTFSGLGPSGRKYTPSVQDYFTYGSSWPSSGHAHRHPTSTEALARFSHLYIYIKPWEAGQGRHESIHEHEALRSSQRNRATGLFAAPSDAFVFHRRAAVQARSIPNSHLGTQPIVSRRARSPSASVPPNRPPFVRGAAEGRRDEHAACPEFLAVLPSLALSPASISVPNLENPATASMSIGQPESTQSTNATPHESSQRDRATGLFAAPSDAFVFHRRAAVQVRSIPNSHLGTQPIASRQGRRHEHAAGPEFQAVSPSLASLPHLYLYRTSRTQPRPACQSPSLNRHSPRTRNLLVRARAPPPRRAAHTAPHRLAARPIPTPTAAHRIAPRALPIRVEPRCLDRPPFVRGAAKRPRTTPGRTSKAPSRAVSRSLPRAPSPASSPHRAITNQTTPYPFDLSIS